MFPKEFFIFIGDGAVYATRKEMVSVPFTANEIVIKLDGQKTSF